MRCATCCKYTSGGHRVGQALGVEQRNVSKPKRFGIAKEI